MNKHLQAIGSRLSNFVCCLQHWLPGLTVIRFIIQYPINVSWVVLQLSQCLTAIISDKDFQTKLSVQLPARESKCLSNVSAHCVIFQGDTPSQLLFCLSLNLHNYLLSGNKVAKTTTSTQPTHYVVATPVFTGSEVLSRILLNHLLVKSQSLSTS